MYVYVPDVRHDDELGGSAFRSGYGTLTLPTRPWASRKYVDI